MCMEIISGEEIRANKPIYIKNGKAYNSLKIIQTQANYNTCKKCSYKWVSRIVKPRQCPNCKRQIKYEKINPKLS